MTLICSGASMPIFTRSPRTFTMRTRMPPSMTISCCSLRDNTNNFIPPEKKKAQFLRRFLPKIKNMSSKNQNPLDSLTSPAYLLDYSIVIRLAHPNRAAVLFGGTS